MMKYLDDMVENLAESPWMCSDGQGSAPIEIPKEGAFFHQEQERQMEIGVFAVWRRRR
jgi:hypothetical protein